MEVDRPLDAGKAATLDRLLTYGAPATAGGGREVLVTPRLGTISPWSSKATDIATHCGLAAVRRTGRGTVYHLDAAGELDPILPLLHDRMTEAVLGSFGEADELFHHFPPKPLTTIDVLARGREAIVEANAAFGLAVAPDEIDYLVAYFTGRRRNPTDVELTMFAQANSGSGGQGGALGEISDFVNRVHDEADLDIVAERPQHKHAGLIAGSARSQPQEGRQVHD